MRRTTAVGPAWCRPASSAASSRSATKTAAASANAGTETLTTSPAVRGRSSVVPIRSRACRSQSEPTTRVACCAMTSTPEPGPASGSHRMATGPLPPANAMASVEVQTRPARTSASASPASSRWPGPVSSTSRRSRPVTAAAGWPNSRSAVTGQESTRPSGSMVNAARPARSGARRRGSTGRPSPATQDSTSTCTIPADRPRRRRVAHFGNGHADSGPRCRGPAHPLPKPCAIVQAEMYRTTLGK